MAVFLLALILSSFFEVGRSAYCSGKPDPGERVSTFDIYDQPVKFVRSVENAMLFEAGPTNSTFSILHLWGTPYENGYAQGKLLKSELKDFVYKTWSYLETEIISAFGDTIPQWAKIMIAEKGLEATLDWTRKVTAPFTAPEYAEEIQGLSDASGISLDLLWRLNMFPELTKAQCSFFGAWDTAVAKTGHAYQLRALDFDTDGPFKEYPFVTVYHPAKGYPFAQVGFPGTVGLLTGFSSQQLAISEIGVAFPDDSFGQGTDNTPPEKVHGEPWMFVLRDVMQYEQSLDSAKVRISEANRTCNLIIGVGDGKAGKATGCQYSGYVANFYEDYNLQPVNETWHSQIVDVVYNGMDWLCPGFNSVLGDQLRKYHGAIDEEVVIKNILPTVMTGSLHVAVYDLKDSTMHVSFARGLKNDPSTPFYAYQRQFTRLRMTEIFAQAPPNIIQV